MKASGRSSFAPVPAGRSQRRQKRFGRAAAYVLLLIGSAVFVLPFLWMVSGSFKDLETVFEYPPSLLPMETLAVERGGKRLKLVAYEPARNVQPQQALLLDQRPGQFLVEPLRGGSDGVRQWVATERVTLLRRVHFRTENYA